MKVSDDVALRFRDLVASRLGLAFPETGQADVIRGLLRACRDSAFSAPAPYVAWLQTLSDQSPEWMRLAGHLTVGETYFLRDHALFEALEKQILPSLIAARREHGRLQLRVWSAGCATGEEPYSLAVLLDRLLPDRSRWTLTILATDINLEALHRAQHGIYRRWSFRNTPDWVRSRYFHRRNAEAFEIDPNIRRMVVFAPLNLNDGSYPSVVTNTVAMDLIFCRNVLMYFTPDAQRACVARLRETLVTGGWLVVSPVEASAELLHPLVPVQCSGAVLYRKEDTQLREWHAPDRSLVIVGDQQAGMTFSAPAGEVTPTLSSVSHAEPLVDAQPDTTSLLRHARELADQGRLDDAGRLCELGLARERLDPEAHLLMAAICQERGETGAALEALRRAIYLDPDSAPAHFLLGSLLLQQGDRRRGRRAMETAVGLLSSRPRSEEVLGTDGLSAGPLLDMARAYLELGR